MHFASRLGHEKIVESLLKSKALINAVSVNNETPLYIAASEGFSGIVKILLEHGADITIGKSPIEIAIEKGFNEVVMVLLGIKNPKEQEMTWSQIIAQELTLGGYCLLKQIAPKILLKLAPFISPLTDAGRAIRDYRQMKISGYRATGKVAYSVLRAIPDPTNTTACIVKSSIEISKDLYDFFKNQDNPVKNKFSHLGMLYASPRNVENHLAVLEITQLLFNQLNEADKQEWADYLMPYAVNTDQNIDIIDQLINYGANATEGLKAALKFTDNGDCLRLFLARGAKLNKIPRQKIAEHYWLSYPVHEAVDAGNTTQLEELLKLKQYSPNTEDPHKTTPLHLAATNGNLAATRILKSKLATSRTANDFGLLPLHSAAINGHTHILSYFLGLGAEEKEATIDQENVHGLTPLHAAIIGGHVEAACRLVDKGADTISPSKRGKTPCQYAIMLNNATRFYFDPTFAIPSIVVEHNNASALEDIAPLITEDKADQKEAKVQEPQAADKQQPAQQDKTTTDQAQQQGHPAGNTQPAAPESQSTAEKGKEQEKHPDKAETTTSAAQAAATQQKTKEQMLEQALDIGTTFRGLMLQGQLVRSLQQMRSNWQETMYAGYYSLYNALSFINSQDYPRLDRNNFTKFLNMALQSIWDLRKHGPCDNLMANEIRHLVNTKYKSMPIVVLDKNRLYSAIIGEITLEQAFDNDKDSLMLWQQFSQGKLKEIAIVAGIGTYAGHWIAIHARNINNTITLQIADSLHRTIQWQFNNLLATAVLPFYLALTNSENIWHQIFTDDLKNEIFEEYVEASQPTGISSQKQNILCLQLQKFKESLHRLGLSLQNILDARVNASHVDPTQIQLTYLHVRRFFKVSVQTLHILVKNLLARELKTQPQEDDQQIRESLQTLFDTLNQQFTTLMNQINRLNNAGPINEAGSSSAYNFIVNNLGLITTLREQATTLIEQISNSEQINQTLDLFDANVNQLDSEHLKIVLKTAPISIINIIEYLKRVETNEIPIRILFVGPPGNGKTTLGQAIAQECNRKIKFIRVSALGDTYQYSRERDLKTLLPFIQKNPNAVIVLDELDAIKDYADEPNRTSQVLQSIIDLCNRNYPNVIFIGTTNDQKIIPRALSSRFSQYIIEMPNPNFEQRLSIIERCLAKLTEGQRKITNKLTQTQKQSLAKKTEGFSIRNIEAIFNNAAIDTPVKTNELTVEIIDAAYFEVNQSKKITAKAAETEQTKRDAREQRRWLFEQGKSVYNTGIEFYQLYQQEKERQKNEWQWPIMKTGNRWNDWSWNRKAFTYESCKRYLDVLPLITAAASTGISLASMACAIAAAHPIAAAAIGTAAFVYHKVEQRDAKREADAKEAAAKNAKRFYQIWK